MFARLMLVSIVLALTTSCSSCAFSWSGTEVMGVRTPTKQMAAVVQITTKCKGDGGRGSGVLVSKDRILTAQHVVTCEDGSDPKVTVDPGDGTERDVIIEILLPGSDIARLKLATGDLDEYFSTVEIGPRPEFNDEICMGNAVPRRGYHCGRVQPLRYQNDFLWDWLTEHGNSGSGVYHNGKLVGLLVAFLDCQNDIPCVGAITPLQDFPWLIP
jgi:hypothetical protein